MTFNSHKKITLRLCKCRDSQYSSLQSKQHTPDTVHKRITFPCRIFCSHIINGIEFPRVRVKTDTIQSKIYFNIKPERKNTIECVIFVLLQISLVMIERHGFRMLLGDDEKKIFKFVAVHAQEDEYFMVYDNHIHLVKASWSNFRHVSNWCWWAALESVGFKAFFMAKS